MTSQHTADYPTLQEVLRLQTNLIWNHWKSVKRFTLTVLFWKLLK